MKQEFQLDESRSAKAQQWALALRRRTVDYWYATLEGADAAHAEAALATVAVNVLDEGIFDAAFPSSYAEYRRGHPLGRVVVGLEFIRNCEIHSSGTFDLVEVAVFGVPRAGYRQVLSWPELVALPEDFRRRSTGEHPARGETRHFYQQWVANRPVIETLLDAISFFEQLDESLRPAESLELQHSFAVLPMATDDQNVLCRPTNLDRFRTLLPDLACRNTERRAPEWPSADQYLREEDKAIRRRRPAASCREVTRRVVDESGRTVALAGYSGPEPNSYRSPWIERTSQVGRDVRMGCRYFVTVGDSLIDLSADDQLGVAAISRDRDVLLTLESESSEQDLRFLGLLEAHPDLYRRERLWSEP